MSKPETPQIIDIMGALKASLAAHPNAKRNAPKAEAPPSPKLHEFVPGAFNLCVHKTGLDTTTRCNKPKDQHKPAPPANMSEPPILERIRAATRRILDNHAPMRIPADPRSDVDIVLGDCANEILALKAQNASLEAERDNLRMLLAGSDYARVVEELERLRDLIKSDASGTPLSETLNQAADHLRALGGGPLEDRLRIAADAICAAREAKQ